MNTIFNHYTSSEGVPFISLSKNITFPTDDSLDFYEWMYVSDDTPWTILSYEIYGTIEYWWILSSINNNFIFYVPGGNEIKYIPKTYIKDLLEKINI